MAEALLTLHDLLVRYGESQILQVPSLAVYPGEVLAIIGPNGAGKSTLLRVMGLLESPTQGRVFFHGQDVTREDGLQFRRRMASVFQEPLLLNSSVFDNAALGLKLRGLERRLIEERVRTWLERLGIDHLARRRTRGLSGGEAQRTSLARALALDPEILFLDEPFSPLDPPTREGLLRDLERILRETGITTVFVTHDRDEAFMFGDRIAVLIGGRLLQSGPTMEVFAHPANEEVAHFVGIETKIPGVVAKVAQDLAWATFSGGEAEVVGNFQLGGHVFLCLRPEDITLSPPGAEDLKTSARNRLKGKVLKVAPWGFHFRVTVACGENCLIAFITRPSFLELKIAEGSEVIASFKASAVHVIKRR
jgi:tungstate transport system ATP-binding protein